MFKECSNKKGIYFQVDKDIYEKIKDEKWTLNNLGYIWKNINYKPTTLHSIIMGKREGYYIDHKNRDKLDNRRKNLRFLTPGESALNIGNKKNGKYRGVWLDKSRKHLKNKWVSMIGFNKKKYPLGRFETQKEAALAYNKKAIELHGKFAILNKI